jgi:predicted DNA-binding ribbon-helix-helix protein
MKSSVIKHSVVIDAHKTSVSLEKVFWLALKEIAQEKGNTLKYEIDAIDDAREHSNLSSAIRLHVLNHFRSQCISQ